MKKHECSSCHKVFREIDMYRVEFTRTEGSFVDVQALCTPCYRQDWSGERL